MLCTDSVTVAADPEFRESFPQSRLLLFIYHYFDWFVAGKKTINGAALKGE